MFFSIHSIPEADNVCLEIHYDPRKLQAEKKKKSQYILNEKQKVPQLYLKISCFQFVHFVCWLLGFFLLFFLFPLVFQMNQMSYVRVGQFRRHIKMCLLRNMFFHLMTIQCSVWFNINTLILLTGTLSP